MITHLNKNQIKKLAADKALAFEIIYDDNGKIAGTNEIDVNTLTSYMTEEGPSKRIWIQYRSEIEGGTLTPRILNDDQILYIKYDAE